MNNKLKHFLHLVLVFIGLQVHAEGIPYVQQFVNTNNKLKPEVFKITSDANGFIYIIDEQGLSSFNGIGWTTIVQHTDYELLSLASNQQTMYVGGVNLFAKVVPNSANGSTLEHISTLPMQTKKPLMRIKNIITAGDSVIFVDDYNLFVYHENSIKNLELSSGVTFIQKTPRGIFLKNREYGLLKFENFKLIPIKGGDFYKDISVVSVVPFGKSDLLIVTQSKGIFLHSNGTSKPIKGVFNNYIEGGSITAFKDLNNKQYVLSTSHNGVLILSKSFTVDNHLTIKKGLNDNKVNDVHIDTRNNLWLATSHGIYLIEASVPISYYNETSNLFGMPLNSAIFENQLFVATSKGLFYKPLQRGFYSTRSTNSFLNYDELFSKRVNSLLVDLDNIYVGYSDGIARVDYEGKLEIIQSNIGPVNQIIEVKNTNYILAVLQRGIVLIDKNSNTWDLKNLFQLKNFKTITQILCDYKGNIWAKDTNNQLFKISINFSGGPIKLDYSLYSTPSIATQSEASLYLDRGEIALLKGKYILKQPLESEDFEIVDSLAFDLQLKNVFSCQKRMNNLWIADQKGIHFIPGNKSDDYNNIINRINKNEITHFNVLNDGNVIVGTTENLVLFNTNEVNLVKSDYQAFLGGVSFYTYSTDSIIHYNVYAKHNESNSPDIIVDNEFNNIKINYTTNLYGDVNNVKYLYYLEGYDKQWQQSGSRSTKEYTNLPSGEYKFHLKAINAYGVESNEVLFSFVVLKPFYSTLPAIVIFILLGIGAFSYGIKLYTQNLKRRQEELQQVINNQTHELRVKNSALEKQKEDILAHAEAISAINNDIKIKSGTYYQQKVELEHQKRKIEEVNKNMRDSILYAKRIQDAMLPRKHRIIASIPESFVFYRPKDIVSGDFYWLDYSSADSKENRNIITAVDCTGHGVPGAFMSMIGMAFLSKIVNQKRIEEVDLILNNLHHEVVESLKQKYTKNNDGADMALCVYYPERNQLEFAGANNPLVYVKNGEIHLIPGDKMPIGGITHGVERKFTKHVIDIDAPTEFYIFSDGYQDQFGGPKDKKFRIQRLKEMLLEIHELTMYEQHQYVEAIFDKWKGNNEQTDDVVFIGFRFYPNWHEEYKKQQITANEIRINGGGN